MKDIQSTLKSRAGWLRLKCAELSARYRMPTKSAIAKMSGDDSREDKDRIMADFLNGCDILNLVIFFM